MTLRVLTGIILAIIGAYTVSVIALWSVQRRMLFQPDRRDPSPVAAGVPEMRIVSFTTEDGILLRAWYAPAPQGHFTLLYCHGNGGNLGDRGGRARWLLDAGFGLLLLEYRGYGGNPGQPTEAGLARDAQAAMDFLNKTGTSEKGTVLYGESLGTAVAVRLAAERAKTGSPVAAVVLEAPFSSVTDIAASRYPWVPVRWLLKDPFDARARIADIDAPVMIIHGEDDDVVPVRFGRTLFQSARNPKEAYWIPGAAHDNLSSFGLRQHVEAFLRRVPRSAEHALQD